MDEIDQPERDQLQELKQLRDRIEDQEKLQDIMDGIDHLVDQQERIEKWMAFIATSRVFESPRVTIAGGVVLGIFSFFLITFCISVLFSFGLGTALFGALFGMSD